MARTRRRFTADYRVEAAHGVIDPGPDGRRGLPGIGCRGASERAELARLPRRVVERDRRITDQAEDVNFLENASAYFAAMKPT